MSDSSSAAISTTTAIDAWFTNSIAVAGESRVIEVGGARIHYLVWGAGDASKPVLLLVHGMLGHAHWWDTVAPYFADEYKVLAIDLSGMGDSTWREAYDGETFTDDIAGVIERESSAPVTIFGHSFGGSRALLSCITRPELFRHAVIIDSAAWTADEPLPVGRMTRGSRIYPDRDSALARFRLEPEQPVCTPLLRAHIAAHSLRRVAEGWTWKFDPRVANERAVMDPSLFACIRTPMDFVYGERSRIVSSERIARIAARIPTASKPVCIPEGHHHLMLDQPIALISTLRALVATPRPTHL